MATTVLKNPTACFSSAVTTGGSSVTSLNFPRVSFISSKLPEIRCRIFNPNFNRNSAKLPSRSFEKFLSFAANGETAEAQTETEEIEPDTVPGIEGNTDGANDEDSSTEGDAVEPEPSSAVLASLSLYKEALTNGDEAKVAEVESFLKSVEDEKVDLEKIVATLSQELSSEKVRILRISADFDNFRKRTERERLSLVTNAQGELVESLLPVMDNFERAKVQIKVETEGEEKITNSYQSIYKQFVEIMGSLGVVPVETVGKPFDPMLHEAIMREDSTEYEDGLIIEEYRKGFQLGERLLRPSMVKVSAGPGPAKPETGGPSDVQEEVTETGSDDQEMEGGDIHEKLLRRQGNDKEEEEEEISLKNKIWRENKRMWIVAGPAIFTRFSTFGVTVISQAFVGHVGGATELAAYALVITLLTRFANGLLLGAASGLETLCGQAYGANQQHMLGVYLQRSWIVLIVLTTLLLPIYIFAAPILIALGQDEVIAQEAGVIALWFIPIIYSFFLSFSCQMFLQAQSKNMIITYLAAFTLGIHVFLSWLLTVKYKFGVPGVMVSTVLAYWIPNIGQLIFIVSGGCPETWNGFSTLAFKDLWPVIKLSLSSGAMLCLELWYNAILILLTGNLKNAQNIVLISFGIGFVLFIFFLFFRERLAYIFTESQSVATEVAHLSPLLAFSILMNSIQPVLSGVAIGAGWQSVVVYVNLGSYYLVGIPFGIVLGYVIKLQVEGVWIGMLIGTFIQTIVLIIIASRTDWDKQVSIAHERVSKWAVKDEPDNNSGAA
ncbi:hypothetical protein ACJIZ3_025693 [Penstemon smallii]|uniref:Multifunctional fusion protein n=1 Tax=Penstemon smallii TaxID=265156 RepID=A0ABD3TY02_9LAMI